MTNRTKKINFRTLSYIMTMSLSGKFEILKDIKGLSKDDPRPLKAIKESLMWLERAQDFSVTKDNGVACHYSLIKGWGASYPETTGYIIPTFLECAIKFNNNGLIDRAERMLDWLISIQLPEGSFQAGTIGANHIIPCTFNTGQILLGLASGVRFFGKKYRKAMDKAAQWLVETQDSDGCWRNYPSPNTSPGEKTYETHVSWGLIEAAKINSNEKYVDAALNNSFWAIKHQIDNGWIKKCCLTDPINPLTHTIGYAFRGILETYLYTKDKKLFLSCKKLADGLLKAIRPNGFIPGRLSSNWQAASSWACLTGSVQISCCWFIMYKLTGDKNYLSAALAANKFVRRTQRTSGPKEIRGGIKGSFPVFGGYHKWQFPNWPSKFFIDSNLLEIEANKVKRYNECPADDQVPGAFD